MGYRYEDSVTGDAFLQHQTANQYDFLDRLTRSTATALPSGTVNWDLNYAYDRFGNMTCMGGTGLCF
jgi:hypothetical protein